MIGRRETKAGVRYDVRLRDPDGRVYTRTFPTKKAALDYEAAERTDQARGLWYDSRRGRILLADFVEQWQGTVVNLRPSSQARDASYIRTHILPAFGSRPIGSITPMDVRTWVADLSTRRAPATVTKALQILRKVMRVAVEDGVLQSNPAGDISPPSIPRVEMRYITPEQVVDLADAMDARYRAVVYLGAYGGLRAGELFGLRGRDVDPLRNRVDVRENVVEVHGRLYHGEPKSDRSRRSVPLPTAITSILTDHMKQCATGPDDCIFTSPRGEPVRLNLWRRRFWYSACVATGLGEVTRDNNKRDHYTGLRIHDLRHTAVAFWISAGASPKEIADRAGHRSVSTVLDRYGHLLPGSEEKVNDALDVIFRAARKGD